MKKFNAAVSSKAEPPPIYAKIQELGEKLVDEALKDTMTTEVRLDIFKAMMTFAQIHAKIVPAEDLKGSAFNGVVAKIKAGSALGDGTGAGGGDEAGANE